MGIWMAFIRIQIQPTRKTRIRIRTLRKKTGLDPGKTTRTGFYLGVTWWNSPLLFSFDINGYINFVSQFWKKLLQENLKFRAILNLQTEYESRSEKLTERKKEEKRKKNQTICDFNWCFISFKVSCIPNNLFIFKYW